LQSIRGRRRPSWSMPPVCRPGRRRSRQGKSGKHGGDDRQKTLGMASPCRKAATVAHQKPTVFTLETRGLDRNGNTGRCKLKQWQTGKHGLICKAATIGPRSGPCEAQAATWPKSKHVTGRRFPRRLLRRGQTNDQPFGESSRARHRAFALQVSRSACKKPAD